MLQTSEFAGSQILLRSALRKKIDKHAKNAKKVIVTY